MAIPEQLARTWSATEFGDPMLDRYAQDRLMLDTRRGVQALAAFALVTQVAMIALIYWQGLSNSYLTSAIIFGALSLHIFISARFVDDIRTLHMLGMTFLIIGALSIAFLAHRTGDLNIGLMAAVVMLFVAVPLVPWALREAATVVIATYGLMTASLLSVPGRFAPGSLLALQLLILGTALIVVFVTARNTVIRKHDLRARFELEDAHDRMAKLSMQDALTGAWNRRFLDDHFEEIAQFCLERGRSLKVAVIDVDDFKGINDQFGHQVGDEILVTLATVFTERLGDRGYLIRLGGDEFQVCYCRKDIDTVLDDAIRELQKSPVAAVLSGQRSITVSAGIASSKPGVLADQNQLYRAADKALYQAKTQTAGSPPELADAGRTGTWKL